MAQTLFDPPPTILAPIAGGDIRFPIRRIFCVGRNYALHAAEMGAAVDREAPFYFTKSRDAYVESGKAIPYPPGTMNYQFEMELVVAIGTPAFQVAREQALNAVFGYACGLDMTRRDLQLLAREKQRPWDLGKDFEQSAVLGLILPASECGHLTSGSITLSVNGAERQRADIADLIHPVDAIIADLSKYYHLAPGDLIYTGTPAGVGAVEPGDRLEGAIEGLGQVELTISAVD